MLLGVVSAMIDSLLSLEDAVQMRCERSSCDLEFGFGYKTSRCSRS